MYKALSGNLTVEVIDVVENDKIGLESLRLSLQKLQSEEGLRCCNKRPYLSSESSLHSAVFWNGSFSLQGFERYTEPLQIVTPSYSFISDYTFTAEITVEFEEKRLE